MKCEHWTGKQKNRKLALGRLSSPGVVWRKAFLGDRNQILFPECLRSWNTVSVRKDVLNE